MALYKCCHYYYYYMCVICFEPKLYVFVIQIKSMTAVTVAYLSMPVVYLYALLLLLMYVVKKSTWIDFFLLCWNVIYN